MMRASTSGESRNVAAAISFPIFLGAYHTRAQLPDGRPSVIVDPGSVQNLCGDRWAEAIATAAIQAGRKPTHAQRAKPLDVSGVGNGAQACHYDCVLPVAFRPTEQPDQPVPGNLTVPAVANSDLPGLLGLEALRDNRALLEFTTNRLFFCGPGDIKVERAPLSPRD